MHHASHFGNVFFNTRKISFEVHNGPREA